jgi:hypothetical protein
VMSKKTSANGPTCRPTVLAFLSDEKLRAAAEIKDHVVKRGFKPGIYFSTITSLSGKDPRPNRRIDPPDIKITAGGVVTITKTGLKWLAEYNE